MEQDAALPAEGGQGGRRGAVPGVGEDVAGGEQAGHPADPTQVDT